MKIFVLTVLLIGGVMSKTLKDDDFDDEENEVQGGYENMIKDPCSKKVCGLGKECDLDEDNKPICVCTRKCALEEDPRAKVCSTMNVTFESECELYRQKCLCRRNQQGCTDRENRRGHLDYFGECKEIPQCKDWELEEYPIRMRQWLYLVMEELANRRDLQGQALKLAQEAKTKHNKKWVIPVIWKFCDLDKSMDKMISTRELLPISAPLKPLEHCTGPFLESCDKDGSGDITLSEWGQCLGLESDDIEDMCETLRTPSQ
ncbi:hypothetical protein LSH36_26g12016 [Paralvinella palmiformis]|uniref:Kazal-like domain-containing protein n=1 Tax=Paralvinella palmiformis TaxID=53620 RepID=A0AAD9KA93_9ANNE|nr:hypothetical protein LSH36_26g12016 [Paralvinella palmiformis]